MIEKFPLDKDQNILRKLSELKKIGILKRYFTRTKKINSNNRNFYENKNRIHSYFII
ncbi:hypothetical protein LEP1GSC038_2175 [Leptospira weilii str. 2006001855]|uniref:Uncharacterized protein n=1 Tax=Leptospira weilii str. 2006001855 TaxID=996804 RepID=M6FV31_9LEPT|nr:hypothetical protein LEP1GSC038_2175 [Leptospira weilii str. 2006001855]